MKRPTHYRLKARTGYVYSWWRGAVAFTPFAEEAAIFHSATTARYIAKRVGADATLEPISTEDANAIRLRA